MFNPNLSHFAPKSMGEVDDVEDTISVVTWQIEENCGKQG